MPTVRPRDKLVYKGTVNFTVVALAQAVTFPMPMSDNSYDIYWNMPSTLTVNISITNKTVNGFTIVLGVSLAAPSTG